MLIAAALVRIGLLQPGAPCALVPLTGGVSSDIFRMQAGARRFCIKRTLSRLKFAAVWKAPIGRNAAEAAWLCEVGAWFPSSVPAVLGKDAALGLLAMEYPPEQDHPV